MVGTPRHVIYTGRMICFFFSHHKTAGCRFAVFARVVYMQCRPSTQPHALVRVPGRGVLVRTRVHQVPGVVDKKHEYLDTR